MGRVSDIREHMGRCEWCGEPAHGMPLMCPRITKVKYGEDGEITVYFTETPIVFSFPDTKLSPE